MIRDQDQDPASRLSADDAVHMAVKALQEAASIVPATSREDDDTDDDDDEGQSAAPAFIKKLKDLVDDTEIDSTVWSTDGASFVIHEPKLLTEQLVKYFKSSKLKSFVRQLHFYGFKKIAGSRSADWTYNHKYFQQHGRLVHKLRRKTCGPDQQIKNLQTKVDHLQGSLVETQQKLGDIAVALMALMQHHHPPTLLGSRAGAAATPADVLPAKRARRSNGANHGSNNTAITRFEQQQQQQQQRAQTYNGGGGGGGGGGGAAPRKQQARRLPAPMGYSELLSSSMGSAAGALMMAVTPGTEFDFGAEFDDLFTPAGGAAGLEGFGFLTDVETRVASVQGGGHIAVGVTA